jgi:NAD(P)H-nitrite reductase large subunit
VWSELTESDVVEVERGEAHVRVALGERTIDGAVVMGDQALSYPLQELVEERVDLSAAERALATPLAEVICDARGDWEVCRG